MFWVLVGWPPLAFFLVLAAGAGVAVRQGATSPEAVSTTVEARVPLLLAVTLGLVGLTAVGMVATDAELQAGLVRALGTASWAGVGTGAAVGAGIAGLYFGGLERAVHWAQARVGDYVPVGSTAVLGTGGTAFVVANVVLAPLVEEVWYRGLLVDALPPDLGPVVAAAVGCAAFGLFHWPGGAWYVLVTGALVGGACWALRMADGGLAAPYTAHLVLNVIEVGVLTRRGRGG